LRKVCEAATEPPGFAVDETILTLREITEKYIRPSFPPIGCVFVAKTKLPPTAGTPE
jgi:hypothetical protein